MLLSTAYFPPVSYFALLARAEGAVYIDAGSHYVKQSWRNRCRILTAAGPADLNVPVVHGDDLFHTPVGEVRVDYSTPWLPKTQRAIATAYEGSPFFLYYRDALWELLERRPETLFALNLSLIRFFCAKIGIAPVLEPLPDFVPAGSGRRITGKRCTPNDRTARGWNSAPTGRSSGTASASSRGSRLWICSSTKGRKAFVFSNSFPTFAPVLEKRGRQGLSFS